MKNYISFQYYWCGKRFQVLNGVKRIWEIMIRVIFICHKNTYKNRTKYLAKLKSKKVKLFNANRKENMVSMKIKSVKRTNQGIILTGTGKWPVDVVRTKKQREQLENGKIKALGKMWFVKKSYDEAADITSYYLYSSQSAKKWSYVLTPTLY